MQLKTANQLLEQNFHHLQRTVLTICIDCFVRNDNPVLSYITSCLYRVAQKSKPQ